jgi:hypothetical protein
MNANNIRGYTVWGNFLCVQCADPQGDEYDKLLTPIENGTRTELNTCAFCHCEVPMVRERPSVDVAHIEFAISEAFAKYERMFGRTLGHESRA